MKRYFPTAEALRSAIARDGDNLMYAARKDMQLMRLAVRSSVDALLWCDAAAREDKDLALEAVQHFGRALRYTGDRRDDREIVLAAVHCDGDALQFASSRLRADDEIVDVAVEGSPRAIQYAADEARRICSSIMRNEEETTKEVSRLEASLFSLTRETSTIFAYGALMSQASARLTFPSLRNFQLVRVREYRRCFAHPHTFLASRGLLDPKSTNRLASLSAEECPGSSFVAAAFDVDMTDVERAAFVTRESEYAFASVEATSLRGDEATKEGILCVRGSDQELAKVQHPCLRLFDSVWHWEPDSGLLPADVYLRHVCLAAEAAGSDAYGSFLDDTYLADRVTSLRRYLADPNTFAEVMSARPPPDLADRFSGGPDTK